MAKLRLSINSTGVLGVYGIVDIVFNGTTLASAKQLSTTVENLEYTIAGIDNTSNTLKISLLNPQAHDANNDGDYNDAGDQTMQATVSALSYSVDNTTYIALLPQAASNYTIPSGANAGQIIPLNESVSELKSYGLNYEIWFNAGGFLYNEYFPWARIKILTNGNVYDNASGKTFDPEGNEVGAP